MSRNRISRTDPEAWETVLGPVTDERHARRVRVIRCEARRMISAGESESDVNGWVARQVARIGGNR